MAAGRNIASKLFVAKLPWTACRESLTEHFGKYGKILSTKVMFDMKSGRSKKYGFVFFKDQESCEKALSEPSHFIEGQKIALELMTASPTSRGAQPVKLKDKET